MVLLNFIIICLVLSPFGGSIWAHGINDQGVVLNIPEERPAENTDLLPKDLPEAAQGPLDGLIAKLRVWAPGTTLTVCFMGASVETRKRIAQTAKEWTKFTNLTFDFGQDPNNPQSCEGDILKKSHIKIGFEKSGHWSHVGTASHEYTPSLNLQGLDVEPPVYTNKEFRRAVLHEFGHALGLLHEHQNPQAQCSQHIDWDIANEYYAKHFKWSEAKVKFNLMAIVVGNPEYDPEITTYDTKSIMHYDLPVFIFKDGKNSPCYATRNYDLSPGDKEAIAKIYPEDKEKQIQEKRKTMANIDSLLEKVGISGEERQATAKKLSKFMIIENSTFKQETSGNCSPVVAVVGGNVTINGNCD